MQSSQSPEKAEYLKAKYKVTTVAGGDQFLLRSSKDRFRFIYPDYEWSGNFDKFHFLDEGVGWIPSATKVIRQDLAGELEPFYIARRMEKKIEKGMYSCSIQGLMINGCKCGGR